MPTSHRQWSTLNQASTDRNEQFGLAVHVGTATAGLAPIRSSSVTSTRPSTSGPICRPWRRTSARAPPSAGGFQNALESPEANNYVPGLAALGQGNWVSVPASELTGLLQGLPERSGSSASSTSEMQQMWTQLRNAFSANATYTKVGTQGVGPTTRRRSRSSRSSQDVEQSLPASLGSIPGASSVGKQINSAVGQLGNRKLVADVWVSDNKVQEIDVDLNQFDHKYGLRRAGADPDWIRAPRSSPPSGATPLDLSKLGGMLGGMLSGGSST